jgi:ankyrin repeat protein
LHGANEVEVAEELLKAGADVNARNKNGETPIFRTFNDRVVLLYVRHGADLSARNLVGRTVPEAVALKGAAMTEALRKAMAEKKNN